MLHHIVRSQRSSEHFRSTSIISITHSVQCVEVCLLVSLLPRLVPLRHVIPCLPLIYLPDMSFLIRSFYFIHSTLIDVPLDPKSARVGYETRVRRGLTPTSISILIFLECAHDAIPCASALLLDNLPIIESDLDSSCYLQRIAATGLFNIANLQAVH